MYTDINCYLVADLIQQLARGPGFNVQEQIKGEQHRAFIEEEEDDDPDYSEEEEEAPQQQRTKRACVVEKPKGKLSSSDLVVPKSAVSDRAPVSLFAFVQEIPRPEIKEHFLVFPYPSGLSLCIDTPESEPTTAVVTLEYKFKRTALREICDATGDNEARTETFL